MNVLKLFAIAAVLVVFVFASLLPSPVLASDPRDERENFRNIEEIERFENFDRFEVIPEELDEDAVNFPLLRLPLARGLRAFQERAILNGLLFRLQLARLLRGFAFDD